MYPSLYLTEGFQNFDWVPFVLKSRFQLANSAPARPTYSSLYLIFTPPKHAHPKKIQRPRLSRDVFEAITIIIRRRANLGHFCEPRPLLRIGWMDGWMDF